MKILRILSHNTVWKLISLGLAILLWFVVINIENPMRTRVFIVKLEVQNISAINAKTHVVSNLDTLQATNIALSIKGTRLALEELQQRRGEISAWIDLSKIDLSKSSDLTFSLNVETKLPSIQTLDIDKKNPSTQAVIIDQIITDKMPIEVSVIGSAGTDYFVDAYFSDKEFVDVTGPKSSLEKIDRIKALIDVSGATSYVTKTITPIAYDDTDKELSDILVENIMVTVPVKRRMIIPIGNVIIEGSTPSGYAVNSITTDKDSILVAVPNDMSINELTLPIINIDGISEDKDFTFNIGALLPRGFTYLGSDKDIIVSILFSEVSEEEIVIPADMIDVIGELAPSLNYILLDNSVTLTISGLPEVLDLITPNMLNATIDISGLGVGEHALFVYTEELEGIYISERDSLSIAIYELEEDGLEEMLDE